MTSERNQGQQAMSESMAMPLPNPEPDMDLHRLWSVLRRRWLLGLGIFGGVVALTSGVALMQPKVFSASGKLLFRNQGGILNPDRPDFDTLASGEVTPIDTQIELLYTPKVLNRVIAELDLRDDDGEFIGASSIGKRLDAEVLPGTDVLELTYTGVDPQISAAIVNQLMDTFIANNSEMSREDALEKQDVISTQIPQQEEQVRQAEERLKEFREENDFVNLQQEIDSAQGIVAQLNQQIADAESQLSSVSSQVNGLQGTIGVTPSQAIAEATIGQSPGIQALQAQLQEAESQLALERTRFRDNSPPVIELQNRVNALKAELERQIGTIVGSQGYSSTGRIQSAPIQAGLTEQLVQVETQRLGLASQVEVLKSTRQQFQQRLSQLTALVPQQRERERKLAAAQSTYEALLTRLQNLQVEEDQTTGDIRVITAAAIPEESSMGGDAKILIVMGVLLGVLLSVGTIFVLEAGDSSIKTVREAKILFGYNLLGVIPSFDGAGGVRKSLLGQPSTRDADPRIIVRDNPGSPASDAFQRLQANIELVTSGRAVQVIVVMSSVPGEGKSVIAANLAASSAQLGKDVLLVDADMRRPTQHMLWNVDNEIGLSNTIAEPGQLRYAVKEVMPSLDLISSGDRPTNSAALLQSRGMLSLMKHFTKNYELIVIDAPPLNVASDALVLGKQTDGVLFVSRLGVVDPAMAVSAIESLEQSGQNVLGLVVNDASRASGAAEAYGYYGRYSPAGAAAT